MGELSNAGGNDRREPLFDLVIFGAVDSLMLDQLLHTHGLSAMPDGVGRTLVSSIEIAKASEIRRLLNTEGVTAQVFPRTAETSDTRNAAIHQREEFRRITSRAPELGAETRPTPGAKKKLSSGFAGFLVLALIFGVVAKCSSDSGSNSGQTVQEYCDSKYPNTSLQNYDANIKCLYDHGVGK